MDDLLVLVEVMEAGAELSDDGIQRIEVLVSDVVLAQVIPDVFDRVEFGAIGRKRKEVEGRRDSQGSGFVPTGAIQQHQAMVVGGSRRRCARGTGTWFPYPAKARPASRADHRRG